MSFITPVCLVPDCQYPLTTLSPETLAGHWQQPHERCECGYVNAREIWCGGRRGFHAVAVQRVRREVIDQTLSALLLVLA